VKQIDIAFTDKSPEGVLSRVPLAESVRFYESSVGGVSVVTRHEGEIQSGLRISREDAIRLYHALGDYLLATNT
jgi:hypothetical protein